MRIARLAAAVGAALAVSFATAGTASAHVTITEPGEKGGFSIVTFSVPNERDDAGTVTLEVQLPADHPLAFVSVQPKPGWSVTTTTRTLEEPIEVFGEQLTEVVDTITWTGGPIEPGQFDTFSLSVGPLPDDVDELTFPAIQTYSSGEEVAWIDPPLANGEEPEHPAPTLTLLAADEGGHGATVDPTVTESTDDDGTDGIALAALAVGVVAALLAIAALVSGKRQSSA